MISYAMPHVNHKGASQRRIDDALVLISESGGSEGFVESAAKPPALARRNASAALLGAYTPPVRVALEIATQEQQERKALEDELSVLRHEWLEAEQIAGIVDRLTLETSSPTSSK